MNGEAGLTRFHWFAGFGAHVPRSPGHRFTSRAGNTSAHFDRILVSGFSSRVLPSKLSK